MRIGCSCKIDKAITLKNLGINEIELPAGWIAELSESEFAEFKTTLRNSGVNSSVCNMMMSRFIPNLFTGEPRADFNGYFENLFERLNEIGAKTVVFGSGAFRTAPPDMGGDEIFTVVSGFLRTMAGAAEKHSVVIAVEPLCKKETNIINTAAEAMRFIKAVGGDNIRLLVDLYHYYQENGDIADITGYGSYIRHVHIANPVTRICPKAGDGYDYGKFFIALKKAGYDGIISIEAGIDDFEKDISETKEFINSYIL